MHKSLIDAIRRNFNQEGKPIKDWIRVQGAKEQRLKELEAKFKAMDGQVEVGGWRGRWTGWGIAWGGVGKGACGDEPWPGYGPDPLGSGRLLVHQRTAAGPTPRADGVRWCRGRRPPTRLRWPA